MGTGSRYRQVSVPVARNVVRRDRLFGLLDAVVSTPVVLVCAPAGAGKSLLVASWWTDRAFRYGGWVNVSAARNSAGEVWHSILQALQPAGPAPTRNLGLGLGVGRTRGGVGRVGGGGVAGAAGCAGGFGSVVGGAGSGHVSGGG